MFKNLISLMRLRTLPLAVTTVITANSLAWHDADARVAVLVWVLLTVLLLQITSNIANDYADGIRGTDGEGLLKKFMFTDVSTGDVNNLKPVLNKVKTNTTVYADKGYDS
ncbi:UbiA prenyltransferase family protein [Kingella kingae]|uniref:1,4-dihydroxy-2-naphthoate octaprenyltransferase n=3 Tax=Kingella kingae TaxID=504 RepID=F5S469_KINKI|nr:1,4-dihydroxy-2-naphthoate octaprenyltransferase [Kingella kingae ATCC 23330]SQH25678.1 1,4-dihydroxy-2-naphthoate octaprenyltransferase [Kingella kingae]